MSENVHLVVFKSPYCAPCKTMEPHVEEVKKAFEGRASVATVDITEEPDTAAAYGIRSVPTTIVLVGGEVRDMRKGPLRRQELAELLQQFV